MKPTTTLRLPTRVLRFPAACLALSAALAAPTAQDAPWRPGTYMKQATDAVMADVRAEMEEEPKLGFPNGVCVLGGYMKPKARLAFGRPLVKGVMYTFVAGGDKDVRELDLTLLDPKGEVIWSEDQVGSSLITYTCKESGTYTLRLDLSDAPSASFVAAAVLSDEGAKVPVGNFDQVWAALLRVCSTVNFTKAAKFHEGDNQWSLYGAVVEPGQSHTINKVSLKKASYAAVATCDRQSPDINLFVLNGSGKIVAQDVLPNSAPVVKADLEAGLYGVRISNSTSAKPTMAVWTVLELASPANR